MRVDESLMSNELAKVQVLATLSYAPLQSLDFHKPKLQNIPLFVELSNLSTKIDFEMILLAKNYK
jgi:hypothetical protein